MSPWGGSEIVMTFLKATSNSNSKRLQPSESELSVPINAHTHSQLSGPNTVRCRRLHTCSPRFVKTLSLFSDKENPHISTKILIFLLERRSGDFLCKLLNSKKCSSISHPKRIQSSPIPSLSNPFVLKFTHRHGTNTPLPLD